MSQPHSLAMSAFIALLFTSCVAFFAVTVFGDDLPDEDTSSYDRCRCTGRFTCYCVMPSLCYNNGSLNYYGSGLLTTDRSSMIVERCYEGETCCRDDQTEEHNIPEAETISPVRQCGLKRKKKGFAGGDMDTEFGQFPWMLIIERFENDNWIFQCAGSLIGKVQDNDVVLTAAHCIENLDPGQLRVRAGVWDRNNTSERTQELEVGFILVHEDYTFRSLTNDIALIILRGSYERNIAVDEVCLPTHGMLFSEGEVCVAAGWGRDRIGKLGVFQSKLRKVRVPIVGKEKCQKKLRKTILGKFFNLHQSFLCAGGESKIDTCQGDGGGPLICERDGVYYQAGIVSTGLGCGVRKVPGLYTDVMHFINWIHNKNP